MSGYASYDDHDNHDDRFESGVNDDGNRVLRRGDDEVINFDEQARAAQDRPEQSLRRPNRAQRRATAKETPSALRREAEGVEYLGVEFRGKPYWIPADQLDWSAETILAFEDGKAMSALRGLLIHPDEDGNGDFDQLMAQEPKPTIRDMRELFELVGKVGGFESSGN